MPVTPPSTRRDARYALRPGSSTVQFSDPGAVGGTTRAELTRISIAGLAFDIDRGAEKFSQGMRLKGVTVRIGSCTLGGDLSVRSAMPGADSRTQIGCLFFPDTHESEKSWMALIAGIEAAQTG